MKKSTFFTIVIQINHINKFYYTQKVKSLMLFPRTRWIPRQRTMTLRVMWHESVHLVVCVRTSLCKVRNSIFRVWTTWKVKCGNWKMLSQGLRRHIVSRCKSCAGPVKRNGCSRNRSNSEEKRLLSEQVQLMEKKVTTECKLLAEGFCLPFLRVATFKLPRKSYTYNAVSEGTPRKILGGFLIHTWAWVRVSDLMVGLSEIIVIPRKLIELWWSSTISLHNWFQNLWFTCASQLEWKRSQYWLL